MFSQNVSYSILKHIILFQSSQQKVENNSYRINMLTSRQTPDVFISTIDELPAAFWNIKNIMHLEVELKEDVHTKNSLGIIKFKTSP